MNCETQHQGEKGKLRKTPNPPGHRHSPHAVVYRERCRALGSGGLQTARSRRADFIQTIQVAAASVCMNPHGVHMRQLRVQRKMLNSKDWTVALLAKSRQWRDPGNHRGPNYIPESLEAKLEAALNVIPAYTRYAAPSTALTRVSVVDWRVIGLTSDELVPNSPGLYPLHDETSW